jgi:hypothetical protein
MTDLLHAVFRWFDHNRHAAFAWLLAGLLAAWLVGCDVTTQSLLDDTRQVNATQLAGEVRHVEASLEQRSAMIDAQVAAFNADVRRLHEQIEAAQADLQAKFQFRQSVVQALGGFASDALAGTFNPLSAIGTVVSLLSVSTAVGVSLDNARKNRVISQLKTRGTTTSEPAPAAPVALAPTTPA